MVSVKGSTRITDPAMAIFSGRVRRPLPPASTNSGVTVSRKLSARSWFARPRCRQSWALALSVSDGLRRTSGRSHCRASPGLCSTSSHKGASLLLGDPREGDPLSGSRWTLTASHSVRDLGWAETRWRPDRRAELSLFARAAPTRGSGRGRQHGGGVASGPFWRYLSPGKPKRCRAGHCRHTCERERCHSRSRGSLRFIVKDVALDSGTVANALVTTLERLCSAVPGGWTRRRGGVLAAATGVAIPRLNGVWPEVTSPDTATVSGLLDELAATGLPHCLQLRPGAGGVLGELAAIRGMVQDEAIPLMALEEFGSLGGTGDVSGLSIRQIPADEAEVHARVLARGFDAPPEPFLQLITPSLLSMPGLRCYLGEVKAKPVVTALGVSIGPFVGLFNVATPPEYWGRGYGAAVTVRAMADGVAGGAEWAWLQSSAAGCNLYRHLGFRVLEHWDCWINGG